MNEPLTPHPIGRHISVIERGATQFSNANERRPCNRESSVSMPVAQRGLLKPPLGRCRETQPTHIRPIKQGVDQVTAESNQVSGKVDCLTTACAGKDVAYASFKCCSLSEVRVPCYPIRIQMRPEKIFDRNSKQARILFRSPLLRPFDLSVLEQ